MNRVLVKNAERMMTQAVPKADGIEVNAIRRCYGPACCPFTAVPEISEQQQVCQPSIFPAHTNWSYGDGRALERVEVCVGLRSPLLSTTPTVPKVESMAADARQSLGSRIRQFRDNGWPDLAGGTGRHTAGIGRVTPRAGGRNGEQSPRFETLSAVARALGKGVEELVVEMGERPRKRSLGEWGGCHGGGLPPSANRRSSIRSPRVPPFPPSP